MPNPDANRRAQSEPLDTSQSGIMPKPVAGDLSNIVSGEEAIEAPDVMHSALAPADTMPPSAGAVETGAKAVTSLLPPAESLGPSLRESVEAYERISEPGGLGGGLGGAGFGASTRRSAAPELRGFEPSPNRAEPLVPLPTSELPTIPPEAGAFLEDKRSSQLVERENEELRVGLLARDARIRQLQATLDEANAEAARVERLRRQVAQRDVRLAELDDRVRVLERQVRELDAGIGAGRERERQLGAALEHAKRRGDALENALGEAVRKLRATDAALARAEEERTDLERSLVNSRSPHTLLERARQAFVGRTSEIPGRADDLQAVKGVGPAFERALNVLGVTRYEQIAAWTPDDIIEVARKLRTKPERIQRDGWVESARELAAEKVRRS